MENVLFLPITKVDVQKREVWGRATQEVPDGHKEIFDYLSSKPRFQKWSEAVEKRSQGKSKGNVREMHNAVAAGKLIALDFNDVEKAVDIGTQIVDDKSWEKVMAGVLTGFSIGGNYAKRWVDPKNPGLIRYTAEPHEISLVDVPAVPTATFQLVKMDGSTEMRKFSESLGETEGTSESIEIAIEAEINHSPQETADETPGEEVAEQPAAMEMVEKAAEPEEETADEEETGEALEKSHMLEPGREAEDVAIQPGIAEGSQDVDAPEPIAEILNNEQVSEIANVDNFVPEVAHDGKVQEIDAGNVDAKSSGEEMVKSDKSEEPEWVERFRKTFSDLSSGLLEVVEKAEKLQKLEAEEKEKVIAELKQRGSRVGIARREGEPLTSPKGYPTDWKLYGDPANWSWPVDEKGRGQSAMAYYNGGAGKEKYSAREWNILGRRIARLASTVFGATYTYNPQEKKVERKDKMDEKVQKDMMGLLRQVSSQLAEASEMIGTDPAAAKDLMTQTVAAIDVASDTAAITPGAQAVPAGIPTAPIAPDVPGVKKADENPEPALEKKEEPAVQATDPAIVEILKQQGELLKTLTETVTDLKKQASKKPEDETLVPLGDLQALLKSMPEESTDLVKALNEGNLKKAFEAVGNDPLRLYEQVQDVATKQIAMQGINVSRFGFYPEAVQLIEEPKQ